MARIVGGSLGWCVGVDLGGTWIRVTAVGADRRRRSAKQPSPGLGGLRECLTRLWVRWRLSRADVQALVVASRGVWTGAERRHHAGRLRGLARRVVVIPDVEAAYLGALGDRPGILLLAGTGSMALGRSAGGRWARAGGLWPLLGDEGSAFWIGREWLRTTMGSTSFAKARRMLRSHDPVARIASLAPRVMGDARRDSGAARRIVAASQDALAGLLVDVARELRLEAPVLVSWSGGLLADERFRAGIWRAIRRRGVRVNPSPPRQSALAATVLVGERLVRGGVTLRSS